MSSVTATSSALPVQSQNQPVQSEENCCQRAWRWIAETVGYIWNTIVDCLCGFYSESHAPSQQSTTPTPINSQVSTRLAAPTVQEQAPTLPSGAARTDDEIGDLLTSAGIAQSSIIQAEVFIRTVDSNLRQTLPVGCLLSSIDRTPAVYIVVPYVEGLEGVVPTWSSGGTSLNQWPIYHKDGQKFFAFLQFHFNDMQPSDSLPPPLVPLLPEDTVYFNGNASVRNALNEQLASQLSRCSVDSPMRSELGNNTYLRMQRVQVRLRVDGGFRTPVGCLLRRSNRNGVEEPTTYIVLPYKAGVVEFLQRELPNTTGLGSPTAAQWQVYTEGETKFIGGFWRRFPPCPLRQPPALTPYVGPPLP